MVFKFENYSKQMKGKTSTWIKLPLIEEGGSKFKFFSLSRLCPKGYIPIACEFSFTALVKISLFIMYDLACDPQENSLKILI